MGFIGGYPFCQAFTAANFDPKPIRHKNRGGAACRPFLQFSKNDKQ